MFPLALFLGSVVAGPAVCPAPADLGQPQPQLTRMFAPLSAPSGTYVVTTSSKLISELAAELKACDAAPAPGAWALTRPEVHDAFGQAGIYDRARLAQLFGGRRLDVVRGSLTRSGARYAYTLISPYPAVGLDRVEPGTMVIAVRITQ